MQGKTQAPGQSNFLYTGLAELLNPQEPLYKLAHTIPWKALEEEFAGLYSKTGQPAKPIRLMVSLLILKEIEGWSDEEVVMQWQRNPYYQYLSGEVTFQWKLPCDPTDLVYFRKRLGEEGIEKILAMTVSLHGKAGQEKEVVVDTTVQEKNITFPTDAKLHNKIIKQCQELAKKEGIQQRQSYSRTRKQLMRTQHNRSHPKRAKQAKKAARKLRTIAGRVVRELERELPAKKMNKYKAVLERYNQVLKQTKKSKNKIYSLHAPEVACIAKGKSGKLYEFGAKVAVVTTKTRGIVLGMKTFGGNPYDGNTLEKALDQAERVQQQRATDAYTDRGFRGRSDVGETTIHIAGKKQGKTAYEKRKWRKQFRMRAAIEPRIGHMKQKTHLGRNYLKGATGDQMNALLAGIGRNIILWLRDVEHFLWQCFLRLFLLQKAT